MSRFGPSVGEPGYLPYCGGCSTMARMVRTETEFVCRFCGNHGRSINGEDMFDRTAPASAIEARSDATGTGAAEGESAALEEGDAQ